MPDSAGGVMVGATDTTSTVARGSLLPTRGPDVVPLVRHRLLVALLGSGLAVLAFTSYPPGADAVVAGLLAAALVIVAATDLERRIIPNRIVLPATALVLAARFVLSPQTAPEFLFAAIAAGAAFLVPSLINSSWVGMGDVKLVVLLGAGLGWAVVGAITVACMAIFPVAVATLVRRGLAARKATLPFGPFLALGALVILIVPRLLGVEGG